jgi:hypothetical protein
MFVKTKLDEALHPWLYHRAPDEGDGDGGGTGGDTDGSEDEGDADDSAGDTKKTFTEADMNRIRIRETKKAESAARRKVLEDLGVSDPAEAKKIIDAAKKASEKDKTEQDRLREKATQAEREAQAAKAEAAQLKLDRDVDRALAKAKVDGRRLDRIAKLVLAELGDDPDADDIKTAIDTIRDDFPEAFAEDDGEQRQGERRAPSGEGRGGTPPKGQRGGGKENPETRGRERARMLQGRTTSKA